jgi:hypothetical protein
MTWAKYEDGGGDLDAVEDAFSGRHLVSVGAGFPRR